MIFKPPYQEEKDEVEESEKEELSTELKQIKKRQSALEQISDQREKGVIKRMLKLINCMQLMIENNPKLTDFNEILKDYTEDILKYDFETNIFIFPFCFNKKEILLVNVFSI